MIIHQLNPSQCRDVLARAYHGRLGCSRSDQPYIVPIFFYLDADANCLYSFSTVGQKITWMRENPQVCVEVDEVIDQNRWTTVIVFGRYEEVSNTDETRAVREHVVELFGRRSHWWLPAAGKLVSGEEHDTAVFYRIHIIGITGRQASQPIP